MQQMRARWTQPPPSHDSHQRAGYLRGRWFVSALEGAGGGITKERAKGVANKKKREVSTFKWHA
jgi:hypothetical protein